MPAEFRAFLEIVCEENSSNETVENAGQQQWDHIEDHHIGEKVALFIVKNHQTLKSLKKHTVCYSSQYNKYKKDNL